jgi:hypothetical protein
MSKLRRSLHLWRNLPCWRSSTKTCRLAPGPMRCLDVPFFTREADWTKLIGRISMHQSYHFHIFPLLEVGMWFAFWCKTDMNQPQCANSACIYMSFLLVEDFLHPDSRELKFFMLPFLVPNPRPAWPNTSGSQPAAAKSAAPSLPCAKANGGHKWRDVKGTKKNPLVFACFCIMFLSLQYVSSFMKLS